MASAVAGARGGPGIRRRTVALGPLHALVEQRPAHLRIADEVAGAEDDALVAVVAVVLAVGVLGVQADDLPVLVLDELDALAAEVPGGAFALLHVLDDVLVDVLDVVALIAVELRVARPGQVVAAADRVGGVLLAVGRLRVAQRILEHVAHVEVALAVRRLAVDPLVAGLAVAGGGRHDDRGVLHEHVAVVLLALRLVGVVDLLIAVEHRAGILHEVLEDVRVDAARGALAELRGNRAGVIRAVAALDEQLGVDVADVLAEPAAHVGAGALGIDEVLPLLLLHDGHGRALVHDGERRADAGMAAAQHDDVERAGVLIDLRIRRGLAQPVARAAVALDAAGHGLRLRRLHLGAGGLRDALRHARLNRAHGRHQRAAGHGVHLSALALDDGRGHFGLELVGQQVLRAGGLDFTRGDRVGGEGHGHADVGVGDGLFRGVGAGGVLVLVFRLGALAEEPEHRDARARGRGALEEVAAGEFHTHEGYLLFAI